MSEITNESVYFGTKVSFQKRAHFRKNATLQLRQKCTNICQIVTPIVGLTVMMVVKFMVVDSMDIYSDKGIYVPFPFLFNMDQKTLGNILPMLNITTCNQWYMYSFDD